MIHATVDVSVVMVPLPAQGHLNQFLHLSRLLAARGLKVHYVGSATHNRQIRDRAMSYADPDHDEESSSSSSSSSIKFHDIHLPPFVSPPPDPNSVNNFPGHLQPAWDAALHLRSPLTTIISSLASSSRRVAIIHDLTMSFAATAVGSHPNVESFSFSPVSATATFLFNWECQGKPPNQVISEFNLYQASILDRMTEDFINFIRGQEQSEDIDSGHLLNTCRAIEGRFIDLLVEQPTRKHKTFAIGPLNPIFVNQSSRIIEKKRHECLDWLDKQPPSSVVYVSFGTTCTLRDEQVAELAAGLEASGQRFIWVLRDADVADIYVAAGEEKNKVSRQHHRLIPSGYLDRIHGRGVVVGGWAPQLEILAHRSTGCFMSHCGWNSCIESLAMGVPVLAWPMHSDQPANALLVANVLGAGLLVAGDLVAEKNVALVSRSSVSDSIKSLMDSEEGEKMRRRAREIGVEVRQAAMEGGTSHEHLDAFVAHISRD